MAAWPDSQHRPRPRRARPDRRARARARHRRLGWERQVQRHRALPLRHPLAGRHGLARAARSRARGRDPRCPLGLHQDRLPGRRGPAEPRRAARQRGHAAARSGSKSSWWATTPRGSFGRPPASTTSPSSPTSPAAATATGTRPPWPSRSRRAAAGRTCASTRRWPRSRCARDRVAGVVLADGSRIGAAHVVLAAGPWSTALAARRRRRPARARPAGPDPPRRPGPSRRPRPGLLRPGLAAVRAHRGATPSCSATATTPTPSGPTPTATASG